MSIVLQAVITFQTHAYELSEFNADV